MAESQNIEWKESWHDEYLKWICGFANAQGGKIYIGMNDDGEVVGISDSKKLMEDIPNKIQNTMGIIADVNLLTENDKEYIEIVISPSSYPVSYKGEYHYRTGSTKQQLRGAALTEFLVSKTGFKWDAVIVNDVKVDDLDKESFDIFRREALRSGRMTKEELDIPNTELLEKLNLMIDGKLKRAAIMLFYRQPERLITGCYVKIGKFEGSELLYQDELYGSLFIIADRVIDLIYLKYLKASISYYKETRVETYPFPRDGIREAVFNALIHCNWAENVPIQIRIEDDAMYISNCCILPFGWTAETLLSKHTSKPYNPDIANAFYRAGYIEAWGRGIQKICDSCSNLGTKHPEYIIHGEDIMIVFDALQSAKVSESKTLKSQNDTLDDTLEYKIKKLIEENGNIKQADIKNELSISLSTVKRIMKKLIETEEIERKGGKRHGYWVVKR